MSASGADFRARPTVQKDDQEPAMEKLMYEDTEKFIDMDFEQRVRQAAYHLWENDGRPDGKETDYWFRALEQLLAKRGEEKTTQKEAP